MHSIHVLIQPNIYTVVITSAEDINITLQGLVRRTFNEYNLLIRLAVYITAFPELKDYQHTHC